MVRVLIIGRQSARWQSRLQQVAADQIEWECARLPAAGLRRLEADLPDAVVLVDDASATRVATLLAALGQRPIGQLIPAIVAAPSPDDDVADSESGGDKAGLVDGVDAWLGPDVGAQAVLDALAQALEMEFGAAQSPFPPSDPRPPDPDPDDPRPADREGPEAGEAGQQDSPSYFIEEIDDVPARPRQLQRDTIFSARAGQTGPGRHTDAVDREAVKRKLKAVRHDDYYAILELRRGAEGAVVRKAFDRLYRRFDAAEIDFEIAQQFEDELAEIGDALEDAWAVLGDARLRQAYLDHTTRR